MEELKYDYTLFAGDDEGGGDVAGVDRRVDDVTGLGGFQGRVYGLEIPHLAHHDHVRILAKRGAWRNYSTKPMPNGKRSKIR